MQIKWKNRQIRIPVKDILILLIPVAVMVALIPVLPDRIPMQFASDGSVNWYLDKRLSFLIGLLPYIIYKSYQIKHQKKG